MTGSATLSECPIDPAVGLIFGRWTTHVLWVLVHDGPMRFTELRERIPAVTAKSLTERLRRLEADGLIERERYAELPPRVVYTATPLAMTLQPVFQTLAEWTEQHMHEVTHARTHARRSTR
ncbi:winged helix-turn-helix transcriptional regulator [Microbacterium sp. NPDC056052]|uniref:winged helix-turn-helix transcriptional regulator n=1 Tax=Microbacterium sp. NPDC056052 TaxID=3345695 RepID=UPI0035E24108